MSSDDIAIRVADVSKHYAMFERPEDRLKQMVQPRLARLLGRERRQYYRDFAALNGVSFEVRRGETVGIIGRNGCGKSTLLQIVCGTLQPTSGSVEVNGRIAALLELGAGFNPEFTGRENVFMNAAILGLTQAEIDARFDAIARFADIGIFIDQPVKTYSSGMYVRLAFAVAINVEPDILVVDEALSVGDEAFQRKCFARIEDIKSKGATILFVSHGAQTIVQLCDRAILMDRGEKILEGRPKTVVNQYQRFINLSGPEAEPVREEIKSMNLGIELSLRDQTRAYSIGEAETTREPGDQDLQRLAGAPLALMHLESERLDTGLRTDSRITYEQAGAEITDVHVETLDGAPVNVLRLGGTYKLRYRIRFDVAASKIRCGFQIKTVSGLVLAGCNNVNVKSSQIESVAAGQSFEVSFSFTCLFLPGTYLVDTGVVGMSDGTDRFLHRIVDVYIFRVGQVMDSYDYGHFSLNTDLAITRFNAEKA